MKVGFIGLGIMGTPMADKLIAGGHQLYANTLNKVPPELVEKRGHRLCYSQAGGRAG